VELCGRLADSCGRVVDVELGQSETPVRDLFAALGEAYPALAPSIANGRVRACVNEALVGLDSLVRAGDEVALFPPVSGG
jgi:molybdopterin synthase sulfur carrier subunit